MRFLVCACLIAVSACDKPAPAAPSAAGAPDFQPTAFTVEVTGHGRPVILIPGLGCPGSVWRDTVAHLDGYQTHVLTLAGFAGNPRIDGELANETRAQLAEYIRAHDLRAPVVVGHSLGGMIAYWLAETDPDLVGATVVVDSGAAVTGDKSQGAIVRDMWNKASDEQYMQQVRGIFGSMAVHRDRLAKYLDEIQKSDRTAIGDTIYETYQIDLRDHLPAIKAPVLTVLADGSSQDAFKHDAAAVPDHTIVVVPNAGHFVMIDDPDQFTATLDHFLATHASGQPVASR
jgi:pimeloyl-ACP methyl ester carboxylesterase